MEADDMKELREVEGRKDLKEELTRVLDEYSIEKSMEVVSELLITIYNVMVNNGDEKLHRLAEKKLDMIFQYTYGEDKRKAQKS